MENFRRQWYWKTTLLSIITADHPQSWKSVIKVNGILRKTGSGVTFFDINNKIGISSPELHALVPQHNKTMKDIIYNGLVKMWVIPILFQR